MYEFSKTDVTKRYNDLQRENTVDILPNKLFIALFLNQECPNPEEIAVH